jgi:hypothetical protein
MPLCINVKENTEPVCNATDGKDCKNAPKHRGTLSDTKTDNDLSKPRAYV